MSEIERLPLLEITERHLQDLVTAKVAEGNRSLEFKQDLKIGNENDKREFCTDVVSFANGVGGLMLHGIKAEQGIATEVVGIDVPNPDALVLQVEQIINSGISPRLLVGVRTVLLSNGRFVVAIKIPRSVIAPHAAGKDGIFRFFTRGTNGKLPMDIPQVRSSFLLSEGLRERLRTYRAERIGRILANDGIVSLSPGHKLILHVIPLASLAEPVEYNVAPFHDYQKPELITLGAQAAYGREFNMDGVSDVYRRRDAEHAEGYIQLFQNGIIEAADAGVLLFRDHGGDQQYNNSVPAQFIVSHLVAGLARCISIYNQLLVETPVFVMVSMMGMRKLGMWTTNFHKMPKLCDRDDLIFPEIVISDLRSDPETLLRPVFDGIWRSFGGPHCPWYQPDGKLCLPRL